MCFKKAMYFDGAKIVKLARSKTLISNIYTNAMTLRRLFAEFIGTFFLIQLRLFSY